MTTFKLVAQRAIMFLGSLAAFGILIETGKRW
jgi:hypothetical protein